MTSFSRYESERLGSIHFEEDEYLEKLRDLPLLRPACSSVGMYGFPYSILYLGTVIHGSKSIRVYF